jgi:hypothetical protein
MKKLLLLLLLLPFGAFAQGSGVIVESINVYFLSLGAMAAIVLPVTEFVKALFKIKGSWAQYLSWLIAVLMALFGFWLKLGIFSDLSLIWALVYGFAAGLISNGVFDISIIQAIINAIRKK